MAPEIHISDETWDRLKRWAVPLEDTVDDAIARVLDAAEAQHSNSNNILPFPSPDDLYQYDENESVRIPLADESEGTERKARARQSRVSRKLPQTAYELPILKSIYKLGSRAFAADVLVEVEKQMAHMFGVKDRQLTNTGTEKRWQNTARWARAALVQKGLIKSDSERGVWELTRKGVLAARNKNQ